MARVPTGYNEGLAAFHQWCGELARGELKAIHSRAAWNLVQKVAGLVRRQYRVQEALDGAPQGLNALVKQYGKDWGAGGDSVSPEQMNVSTMGLLAGNIINIALPDRTGYIIGVNPEATHPRNGRSLEGIASRLENPTEQQVTNSIRSMVYRKVLQAGTGGYGTKKTMRWIVNNIQIGRPIVFRPRDRPVWRTVANDLLPRELKGNYAKDVITRLTAMANRLKAAQGIK